MSKKVVQKLINSLGIAHQKNPEFDSLKVF